MLRTKFFFKNCLIFYWQIVFWPLVYSIKTAKTRHGKIRQFLKKNLVRNIFYPWHHKSPEKHHIELIEAIIVERFFFLVSVDHSDFGNMFNIHSLKSPFLGDISPHIIYKWFDLILTFFCKTNNIIGSRGVCPFLEFLRFELLAIFGRFEFRVVSHFRLFWDSSF